MQHFDVTPPGFEPGVLPPEILSAYHFRSHLNYIRKTKRGPDAEGVRTPDILIYVESVR